MTNFKKVFVSEFTDNIVEAVASGVRGLYYNSATKQYNLEPTEPLRKNVHVPLLSREPEKELMLFAMFHTDKYKNMRSWKRKEMADPPFFCGRFPYWSVSCGNKWLCAFVCGREHVEHRLVVYPNGKKLLAYSWAFQWLYESLMEISGTDALWSYDGKLTKHFFKGGKPCGSLTEAMTATKRKPCECITQLSYLLGYGFESSG